MVVELESEFFAVSSRASQEWGGTDYTRLRILCLRWRSSSGVVQQLVIFMGYFSFHVLGECLRDLSICCVRAVRDTCWTVCLPVAMTPVAPRCGADISCGVDHERAPRR